MTTVTFNAEVDRQIMDSAAEVLAHDDLSVGEIFHRMLTYISIERRIPDLELFEPGPETIAAMAAAERGEMAAFNSISELMADLNEED